MICTNRSKNIKNIQFPVSIMIITAKLYISKLNVIYHKRTWILLCYGAARGMAREGRPGALPTAGGKREGISFLILV
jgi:hypothetical protein